MHTYEGKSATFHYNSELYGSVSIIKENQEVKVSGKDLLDFVAEYVRSKKIEQLEQMTSKELLCGLESRLNKDIEYHDDQIAELFDALMNWNM
ncbi:MAG: hypothetical protein ACOCRO_09550 [Halanaerobiales bacterium]